MKNSVIIGNKIIDYVLLVVLGFLALFSLVGIGLFSELADAVGCSIVSLYSFLS